MVLPTTLVSQGLKICSSSDRYKLIYIQFHQVFEIFIELFFRKLRQKIQARSFIDFANAVYQFRLAHNSYPFKNNCSNFSGIPSIDRPAKLSLANHCFFFNNAL